MLVERVVAAGVAPQCDPSWRTFWQSQPNWQVAVDEVIPAKSDENCGILSSL